MKNTLSRYILLNITLPLAMVIFCLQLNQNTDIGVWMEEAKCIALIHADQKEQKKDNNGKMRIDTRGAEKRTYSEKIVYIGDESLESRINQGEKLMIENQPDSDPGNRLDNDAANRLDNDAANRTDNDSNNRSDALLEKQWEKDPTAVSSPAEVIAVEKNMGIFLSKEDYQCLLKIVEAEAGVCDEKGKILIANVVLNRIQDDAFPDTVTDVVYQNRQFSPVTNGTIDRVEISRETEDAVAKALTGEDYSQGALYFAARGLSDKKNMDWFDRNLCYLFEHDGHEFFKEKP